MTAYLVDTPAVAPTIRQPTEDSKRPRHEHSRHETPRHEGLVRRVRAEFLEMPGLCLTLEQAQRLWSLEPRTCEAVLTSLIDARFLRRTDRGLYVLWAAPA